MATIEKRGNGYRITVSLGYDVDGKQIKERTVWYPDPGMSEKKIKSELNKEAVRFEDLCRQRGVRGGNTKLEQFAETWFSDYAEQQLKPRTVEGYRYLWKRVRQGLGHLPLVKITPVRIIAFYGELAKEGVRANGRYFCRKDFKKYVRSCGIKQEELIRLSGVGSTTVEKLYAGKCVSLQTAEKISAALDVKCETLFAPEEDTPLSGKTLLHYHRFLSTILETAVHWQMIPENPCKRVKPPKSDTQEARYLDEASAAELIRALDDEPPLYRTAILLLINTGLRRGELCALRWSDIDFENQTLSVQRNAVYISGKGVQVNSPKTRASIRVIKLPSSCIPMLKQYRAIQAEYRLSIGDLWISQGDDDYIFPAWNGTIMLPDSLSRWFKKFIIRHQLPDISLHGLRHTNATLLIAAHVDLRTVSGRLGHSRAATTANIYAHAIQSADAAAADVLDVVLNKIEGKKKKVAGE